MRSKCRYVNMDGSADGRASAVVLPRECTQQCPVSMCSSIPSRLCAVALLLGHEWEHSWEVNTQSAPSRPENFTGLSSVL